MKNFVLVKGYSAQEREESVLLGMATSQQLTISIGGQAKKVQETD